MGEWDRRKEERREEGGSKHSSREQLQICIMKQYSFVSAVTVVSVAHPYVSLSSFYLYARVLHAAGHLFAAPPAAVVNVLPLCSWIRRALRGDNILHRVIGFAKSSKWQCVQMGLHNLHAETAEDYLELEPDLHAAPDRGNPCCSQIDMRSRYIHPGFHSIE